MHVIWKRPDGYHGASPTDFRIVEVGGNKNRIWLHNSDNQWFPFRISGGWQEQEATQKLNQLVNLLGSSDEEWVKHMSSMYHHSMSDDSKKFFTELANWLTDLKQHIKGDTWELEVLSSTLDDVAKKVVTLGSKVAK